MLDHGWRPDRTVNRTPSASHIRVQSDVVVERNSGGRFMPMTAISEHGAPWTAGAAPSYITTDRDINSMRDLGHFLRTKEPPPTNWASDAERKATTKSSILHALRYKPKRSHQPLTRPLRLPDTAVAQKTINGHWHIAISIPKEYDYREKFAADPPDQQKAGVSPSYPCIQERTSSLDLDERYLDTASQTIIYTRRRPSSSRSTIRTTPIRHDRHTRSSSDRLYLDDTASINSRASIDSSRRPVPRIQVRAPSGNYVDRRKTYAGHASRASISSQPETGNVRASYPLPPRSSSKYASPPSREIAELLKNSGWPMPPTRTNSAKYSTRSAKSHHSARSSRSDVDNLYDLSQATIANAELARGYCAHPTSSNSQRVRTYRPAGPALQRKLSNVTELSREGVSAGSRSTDEEPGGTKSGSHIRDAPSEQSSGARSDDVTSRQELEKRRETDAAPRTTVSDSQDVNSPSNSPSSSRSLLEKASVSTAITLMSGPASKLPVAPVPVSASITASILLVADIAPEAIPDKGPTSPRAKDAAWIKQRRARRRPQSETISDEPATPPRKRQDAKLSSSETYSTPTAEENFYSADSAVLGPAAEAASLDERRQARRLKRNVILRQRVLEERLRQVETQNAVLVQTLSAVAEMGAGFRELLKQNGNAGAARLGSTPTARIISAVDEGAETEPLVASPV